MESYAGPPGRIKDDASVPPAADALPAKTGKVFGFLLRTNFVRLSENQIMTFALAGGELLRFSAYGHLEK
jgi:hypothetical protein